MSGGLFIRPNRRVVTFGDAQADAIQLLRLSFAGIDSDLARAASVDATVPGDNPNALSLETPYVLVANDGPTAGGRYPFSEWVTLRCTAYSEDRDQAMDLAQLSRGLLLTRTYGQIAGTASLIGPRPVMDPITHQLMVWFTVRAVMEGVDAIPAQ